MSNLFNEIKNFEKASRTLETPVNEREALQKKVTDYTNAFLNTLTEQKAYNINGYKNETADELLKIDGQSNEIDTLINFIDKRVDKTGLNPASGGHLGYIPAGGLYTAALGDYIAAVTNRYAGVFYASPGAVRIENALIKWVGKLIGYKGNFGGNLTSGGSFANLIAIAAARTAYKLKNSNLHSHVIYTSKQAHHSILKALKITGMDECIIRTIPVDKHYRMDIKLLCRQLKNDKLAALQPFMLLANAGSTDVGAIDPLEEMGKIAKQFKVWFHVDAAYGGFFLLTQAGKIKMKGIHLADSVILDPHKGLFLPYGLGVVMVKNLNHLFDANNFDANYMQDTLGSDYEYSPAQLSPELSKHFRGMRMWLPLKIHGLQPFVACLEEKLRLARYFYEEISKIENFEVGVYPDLSVVTFRYVCNKGDTNILNQQLMEAIKQDGRIFISSTVLNGNFTLRLAILSFRTHLDTVQLALALLKQYAKRLEKT